MEPGNEDFACTDWDPELGLDMAPIGNVALVRMVAA